MIHSAPYPPNHVPGSDVFDDFSRAQKSYLANFGRYVPLYTTDVVDLGTTFLDNLPPEERQYHNCRCCLDFIHNYGGLVTVTDTGKLVPVMWPNTPERFTHQGEGVIAVLKGARDTDNTGGAGIFPEYLKAELHGVRATVEAYSRVASIETTGQPAAGIDFRKSAKSTWGTRLRVRTATSVGVYKLDRWD